MFVNFFEIVILSIVQGISEFLPISSSAHLFLISEIYEFKSQALLIDIGLHLGSLLAIIFYFRNDLLDILNNKSLLFLIILGSIPLIIFGLIVYKTGLINYFRNVQVISWTTLVFAIILYFADKFEVKKKFEADLNIKSIFIIGIFQILALIPGVSRSGIVITAGRLLNFDRYDSTKISFYLSIPAISGASFLGLKDLFNQPVEFNYLAIIATVCSFIFSFITVKFFLIYINRFSMNAFVIYRVIISLILFLIIY